jgi:hypothetical protein
MRFPIYPPDQQDSPREIGWAIPPQPPPPVHMEIPPLGEHNPTPRHYTWQILYLEITALSPLLSIENSLFGEHSPPYRRKWKKFLSRQHVPALHTWTIRHSPHLQPTEYSPQKNKDLSTARIGEFSTVKHPQTWNFLLLENIISPQLPTENSLYGEHSFLLQH